MTEDDSIAQLLASTSKETDVASVETPEPEVVDRDPPGPVSYTHLTLPTNREV